MKIEVPICRHAKMTRDTVSNASFGFGYKNAFGPAREISPPRYFIDRLGAICTCMYMWRLLPATIELHAIVNTRRRHTANWRQCVLRAALRRQGVPLLSPPTAQSQSRTRMLGSVREPFRVRIKFASKGGTKGTAIPTHPAMQT